MYPYRLAKLSDAKGDISKLWYVNYYAWSEQKGQLVRKRVVINQPTAKERYQQAEAVIKIINHELENGAVVDPIEAPEHEIHAASPMVKVCQFFLDRKATTVGENTLRGYKKDMKTFQEWLAIAEMEQLPIAQFGVRDAFAFSDYLDERKNEKTGKPGIARKTYSNYISTLRSMWAMLIEREILEENPFLKVKKRKGGRSQHVPYSPEQVRLFKQVCLHQVQDQQLWLFVNFIYYCFLRPREEAQNLQVKHLLKKTIVVPGDIAKNNETEHVRIPRGLEELIQQHKLRSYPAHYYLFTIEGVPGPKPVNNRYMYEHNKKVLELAKMAGMEHDLYGWKHTGVIALYNATRDIKLVQAQCRHKEINTTDIYLRDLGLFLDEDALDLFPEPDSLT